jgi:hypothetical protein
MTRAGDGRRRRIGFTIDVLRKIRVQTVTTRYRRDRSARL